MVDMVSAVGKWLVIGLIVAAVITVFMPDDLLVGLSNHPLLAMLVMVLLAVPMYVCATGSIPIALSLMLKGLTPGVGFVLLMAGPAANMASVMVLNRSLGRRATAIYVGSVVDDGNTLRGTRRLCTPSRMVRSACRSACLVPRPPGIRAVPLAVQCVACGTAHIQRCQKPCQNN